MSKLVRVVNQRLVCVVAVVVYVYFLRKREREVLRFGFRFNTITNVDSQYEIFHLILSMKTLHKTISKVP